LGDLVADATLPLAFRFVLRDMARIVPWGMAPDLSLSWFGLTDGAYCIDTPMGRLLDYRETHDAGLGVSWCSYAVARLWEDLKDLLPRVLEPVPEDVLPRLTAWQRTGAADEPPDDDTLYDAWVGAQAWWSDRQLDLGYLRDAPRLHVWRSGDVILLRWRVREVAGEPCPFTKDFADARISVTEFELAVERFEREFLGAMRARCEALVRDGWQGRPCEIDPEAVLEEHEMREAEAAGVRPVSRTDWDAVREDLDIMGA
jgi:hypothetical protein